MHVAHDAHVVAQDLLGLEDVGLAVEREHALALGELLQPLEVPGPVGVEVQHRDGAFLDGRFHHGLEVGEDEAVPQARGDELAGRAPAADPQAHEPQAPDDLPHVLDEHRQSRVHGRLHLVAVAEEVEEELLHGAAAAEVLVGDGGHRRGEGHHAPLPAERERVGDGRGEGGEVLEGAGEPLLVVASSQGAKPSSTMAS